MTRPYCPKCDKETEKMVLTPHAVYYEEDETNKLKLSMPQFMFIQCQKCGYSFGVVDSELRMNLEKIIR